VASLAAMRVGLTGGIASGKSTVSEMLRELGAVVIDSDQLARDVVAPGTPGLAAVIKAFGKDVLAADGSLDRPKLGAIVFADPERRRELEAITHPLIGEASRALEERARAEGHLIVHDIPLLAEAGMGSLFDIVIVVDVPVELQLQRLLELRGATRDDAEARIAAQASREQRLTVATHVIDNTGSVDDLRKRVEELYAELSGDRS